MCPVRPGVIVTSPGDALETQDPTREEHCVLCDIYACVWVDVAQVGTLRLSICINQTEYITCYSRKDPATKCYYSGL